MKFDIGQMSLHDVGVLAAIGQHSISSVADFLSIMGLAQKCYRGSLDTLPASEIEAFLRAFSAQVTAYFTDNGAATSTPAKPQARRKKRLDENAGPDVSTPDADALLRRLDESNGGIEQR